MCLFGNV